MALFKCKMCGGDLEITAGSSVCTCEYCGTKQTVPTADDEKKMTLFARANRLLRSCEFDKAAGVFETIVADFPQEAEAYWGLVLCQYGIEYVDDPATGKKIPTCHRSSFDSVMDDANFEQACENTDSVARAVYREEAKRIEQLRKDIIQVSNKEEPYDIFICYKETDDKGERTLDSVLAQDTYDALTEKGYKVFFSRISLEEKLGQEYEPYIFAALNSAKVMLAFGTDSEYYEAVWVKNEWSRFLQLIAKGEKKALIPCYKNIDVYDMPKEFAKLQAQDMGRIGAMQDLLRGIEKIIPQNKQSTAIVQPATNVVAPLLERAFLFLEDGKWAEADTYCEKVLDMDPKCGEAYLGKVMAELKVYKQEDLERHAEKLIKNSNYQKAIRYGTPGLAEQLNLYVKAFEAKQKELEDKRKEQKSPKKRNKVSKKVWITVFAVIAIAVMVPVYLTAIKPSIEYSRAEKLMSSEQFEEAKEIFVRLTDYKDSTEQIINCDEGIEQQRKETIYTEAASLCDAKEYRKAIPLLQSIAGYRDVNSILREIVPHSTISGGFDYSVALKNDGTVVAVGNNRWGQCDVENWSDIVEVSTEHMTTVGLKSDGTVVATGWNDYGQCEVQDWTDIVAIAAGEWHTVGLKSDGTVITTVVPAEKELPDVFSRDACNTEDWHDIIAISAGWRHTVGLRADGTVVAVGDNDCGQCEVGDWTDIVMISAAGVYTLGLKSDGTVVAAGPNDGRCAVNDWTDIVSISAGGLCSIGLKSNGTVVITTMEGEDFSASGTWNNIVSITAGCSHCIGLKPDGTVVSSGWNDDGECNTVAWKNIKIPGI